jgi:histone H3/H4
MNDTENMMDENSAENLVVVSKLKTYIKSKAGMSTSGKVPDRLSQAIRKLCDTAIENAQKDGRKTVMDRDIPEATL